MSIEEGDGGHVGTLHEPLERSGITSSRSYRYTPIMHTDHPGAADTMASGEQFKVNTKTFEQLHYLFHESQPDDGSDYARLLGVVKNRRQFRWIRRDYLTGPDSFDQWKVAVAKANGTGSTTDFFGVPLTNPTVLGPGEAVTQTFLTIGSFETEREAQALLNYLKSKFARTMLGVLKVTQDNPASTWKHVPNQDFTASSDIDWNKSIPEIDQQLYAKYGLDADEIAFIEEKVKPME